MVGVGGSNPLAPTNLTPVYDEEPNYPIPAIVSSQPLPIKTGALPAKPSRRYTADVDGLAIKQNARTSAGSIKPDQHPSLQS